MLTRTLQFIKHFHKPHLFYSSNLGGRCYHHAHFADKKTEVESHYMA